MESLPVRFDTSSIADDPEFKRLLTNFSNARMELSAYLNRAMDLTVKPEKASVGQSPD